MSGTIVEYLISWQHAKAMYKKLNIKRHLKANYSFEIVETPFALRKLTEAQRKLLYSTDYKDDVQLFRLKVLRETNQENRNN